MTRPTTPLVMVCVLTLGLLAGGTGIVGAGTDRPGGVGDQAFIDDTQTNTTAEFDSHVDESVDATDETVNETTDEVDETVNETTDEVDETVNETTDEVDETSDEGTDSAENRTGNTTEEIDTTTAETTDSVDEATGESVNETTDTVGDTGNTTTNLSEETVYETTDLADGTITESTILLDDTVNTTTETLDGTISLPTQVGETGSEEPLIANSQYSNATPNSTSPYNSSADSPPDRNQSPTSSTADDASESTTVFTAYLLGIVANATLVGGASSILIASSSLSSSVIRITPTNSFFRRTDLPWEYFASLLRYSRYDDSDPLEHEHRRDVYTGIVENPGISLSELEGMNEISLSVLRHHIRVLETENVIKTEKIRGKRRLYPIEEEDVDLIAALSDSATRRVILELKNRGSARNDELADALECTPSTVSHHLTSLEERGLVIRERDGRVVMSRLSPEILRTLDTEEQKRSIDPDPSKKASTDSSPRDN